MLKIISTKFFEHYKLIAVILFLFKLNPVLSNQHAFDNLTTKTVKLLNNKLNDNNNKIDNFNNDAKLNSNNNYLNLEKNIINKNIFKADNEKALNHIISLDLNEENQNDDEYVVLMRNYLSKQHMYEHVLEKSYHGLIRENETLVEITPLIKINDNYVCDLRIIKKSHHDMPFQIFLVNNLGILKASHQLNCEKRHYYHFEIYAILCNGKISHPANVHISVIDINEYAPEFLQPSYVTEVDEGRLYQEIVRVEATDKDCNPPYGDVCKYEIINNTDEQKRLFRIDNEGSIRNTEPLSRKKSHNHILSVVAYDCAMKKSEPIMVSIKVRRVCEARLLGIPERIDYTPQSDMESLQLFPNLKIELCDIRCENEMVLHGSVALKTKHISFGCDRNIAKCSIDENNLQFSQKIPETRKLVNLLVKNAGWTRDLNFDEGQETVFHFDGKSGAIIPESIVSQQQRHDFGEKAFSIVTMFRHFASPTANKHAKEHIICKADDHKMNRHHMALFVRNCRLILLLRKNFNEGDLNIFSPAEWRWKIPQVCDNEWHHYVLNVQLPKIDLYIDGTKFEQSELDIVGQQSRHSNPEVIDDWPLHAAHGVNTTLTIGSCYQGNEKLLKHGFNGDIAEIKLLVGSNLTPEEIKCGTKCAEYLIPPTESELNTDEEIQLNTQFNELYLEDRNHTYMENLFNKVQYINTKLEPTVGRRNIEVRVQITCPNQPVYRLPTVETYIMVNKPQLSTLRPDFENNNGSELIKDDIGKEYEAQKPILALLTKTFDGNPNNFNVQPKILIFGTQNHLVSYPDIKSGVMVLKNINITVIQQKPNEYIKNPYKEKISGKLIQNLNLEQESEIGNDVTIKDLKKIYIESESSQLSNSNSNLNTDILSQPSNEFEMNMKLQTLDSCQVTVFPSLNPDHEEIKLDGDKKLSKTLDVKTQITKDGVEMLGYDTIQNYLNILRSLKYINKKPAYYLNRVFKLRCSQINMRFRSAEYTLTLTVLHPKQHQVQQQVVDLPQTENNLPDTSIDSIQQHDSKIFAHAMIHAHDVQEPKSRVHSIIHKAQSSHPTILIIVIFVFFILLLCGISIAKLKQNHKYTNHQQSCPKISTADQLDWDDSALTIRINPMQQNDSISEDSSDSDQSVSDDEEAVNNGKYKNVSQMEWDNSTM